MVRTRNYKRIYRYPKQKWSPVIKSGTLTFSAQNPAHIIDLVTNSTDTATPTPVVIKAKHFKAQYDVTQNDMSSGTNGFGIFAGIIYIPEGITIVSKDNITSLIASHPEWVISYNLIDAGFDSLNTTRSSSILSRNLNSGDRICMFAYLTVPPTNQHLQYLQYIVSWVNRAN